jgi:hypothetical protein
VHGSTGNLFGDGIAIWYVQEPNQLGAGNLLFNIYLKQINAK